MQATLYAFALQLRDNMLGVFVNGITLISVAAGLKLEMLVSVTLISVTLKLIVLILVSFFCLLLMATISC